MDLQQVRSQKLTSQIHLLLGRPMSLCPLSIRPFISVIGHTANWGRNRWNSENEIFQRMINFNPTFPSSDANSCLPSQVLSSRYMELESSLFSSRQTLTRPYFQPNEHPPIVLLYIDFKITIPSTHRSSNCTFFCVFSRKQSMHSCSASSRLFTCNNTLGKKRSAHFKHSIIRVWCMVTFTQEELLCICVVWLKRILFLLWKIFSTFWLLCKVPVAD